MSLKRLGLVLFASGLAGLGVLSLLNADFAMYWQPVPPGIPWRTPLACLSGAILLLGGAGMLVKRTAAVAAAVLTGFVLLLHLPGVASDPGSRLQWTMLCVATAYAGAAWTVAGLPPEIRRKPAVG